jgi:hypothetical protein
MLQLTRGGGPSGGGGWGSGGCGCTCRLSWEVASGARSAQAPDFDPPLSLLKKLKRADSPPGLFRVCPREGGQGLPKRKGVAVRRARLQPLVAASLGGEAVPRAHCSA